MSEAAIPAGDRDPSVAGPLGRAASLTLMERADELASTGDYQPALVAYSRLVGNGDPEIHVRALLGVAEARYRLDDEPAALQAWIVATQAPETRDTWRAWKALAAARVREQDLPGAARAYREAERRAPPEEGPEIASRLGWLNKEMGQHRAAARYFGRSRTGFAPGPTVTYAILAVTVAIGLSSLLGTGDVWHSLLQLDKPRIADGEWYRLLTVALVHAGGSFGILHLGSNMYALYLAGPIAEALYGRWTFLFIYLACAAAGSTASFVFSDGPRGVGASGAIFGLFGLLLVANRVHRPALGRPARALVSQLGMLVVLNLFLGFSLPFIDNFAHIGGLLAGAWLGFVLVPRSATLSSFWYRPQGASGRPVDGQGAGARGPVVLLRGAAVLALLAVMVLGVVLGTPRWG